MRMTVLASGSKGNSAVISSHRTRVLVDAGLSCRELLRRMALAGEDPCDAGRHSDHPRASGSCPRLSGARAKTAHSQCFFTEPTHRAWVRMLTPRTTMTYAAWLDHLARERAAKAEAALHPDLPPYASSRVEAVDSLRLRSKSSRRSSSVSAEAAALGSADDPAKRSGRRGTPGGARSRSRSTGG